MKIFTLAFFEKKGIQKCSGHCIDAVQKIITEANAVEMRRFMQLCISCMPFCLLLSIIVLSHGAHEKSRVLSQAAPTPRSSAKCEQRCLACVLRLRGGGRRRKDWQSPRPGDSAQSMSASDPEWSAAEVDEDEDDEQVRREIFGDSDYVSDAMSSGSDSNQPRKRRAGQHLRSRRHSARPERRAAKTRGRVRSDRDRRHTFSEDHLDEEVDSDDFRRHQRPRRVAASTGAGSRWGTQATDALEAALSGKLATAACRPRSKRGSRKPVTSESRSRRAIEEPSEESSELRLADQTSSSAKERRSNGNRTGKLAGLARGGLLDQTDLDADSYDHGAYLRSTVAPVIGLPQAFPLSVNQPSSSISDSSSSHKHCSSHSQGETTRHSGVPHLISSHGHEMTSSPAAKFGQDIPLSTSMSAQERRPDASPETAKCNFSCESSSAVELEDVVTECVGEEACEQVLHGLAQRLECNGDAVLLTRGTTRMWRGVAVTCSQDVLSLEDVRQTHNARPTPTLQSPHGPRGLAARSHGALENLQRTGTNIEASTFVSPVSTEGVLQGLGTIMSQAAEVVARAGQREDLECAGLSGHLMALVHRLDAAREEGECVTALLTSPQQILEDGCRPAAGAMQHVVSAVEEDVRNWRRRAVVSGTWHLMREQAARYSSFLL